MGFGKILYLIAAVLLFLAGIGFTALPSPVTWALFCLALGLLLDGSTGFRWAMLRRR